jgi:predicted amidohydrolase
MKLIVAGAQIPVTCDIQENLQAINRAMDYAVSEKADILITPEVSLIGYTHEFDPDAAEAGLKKVTQKALSSGIALALGTCFYENDNKCYNQLRFYDNDGTFLGFHTKNLTCGDHSDPPRGEINHFTVKPLRTFEYKGITIGGLICNDMWANPEVTPMDDPHLSQKLSKMGARIIFHAVNGGRNQGDYSRKVNRAYHETNLIMRAHAGKVWVVTADNSYPDDLHTASPGGVINPEGKWMVKTPESGEYCFVYKIEL